MVWWSITCRCSILQRSTPRSVASAAACRAGWRGCGIGGGRRCSAFRRRRNRRLRRRAGWSSLSGCDRPRSLETSRGRGRRWRGRGRRRGHAETRRRGGGSWLKFLFFFSAFSAAPREIQVPADGVEIHELALEHHPRHRLQRRVHPPVQLDLVVQRPKHRRDSFLLGEGWEANVECLCLWVNKSSGASCRWRNATKPRSLRAERVINSAPQCSGRKPSSRSLGWSPLDAP